MTVVIKPKKEFEVCVEAEITPELATKSVEEIKRFKVYYGNRLVELGELFEVTKEGEEKKLILDGDFSRVKVDWGEDG